MKGNIYPGRGILLFPVTRPHIRTGKAQYPREVEELTSFVARGDKTNPRSASQIYNDKYVSDCLYILPVKSRFENNYDFFVFEHFYAHQGCKTTINQ